MSRFDRFCWICVALITVTYMVGTLFSCQPIVNITVNPSGAEEQTNEN